MNNRYLGNAISIGESLVDVSWMQVTNTGDIAC